MSIFDSGSGLDPGPWLREKTLAALRESARLVDLANEPDTSPWYADTLRGMASRLVGRLAPVVALVHGAGAGAADRRSWRPILKGGTFALARWCREWKIADPHEVGFAALATRLDDTDLERKALIPAEPPARSADGEEGSTLKIEVYAAFCRKLLRDALPEAQRRFLLGALGDLWASPYADVVTMSKRFLPTDIDVEPAETEAAYRALFEAGTIERVDAIAGLSEEQIAVRLVVGGLNESKHPPAWREETFGYAGARIGGQPTFGNLLRVRPAATLADALHRWMPSSRELAALGDALRAAVDPDQAYVETVRVERGEAESVVVVGVRMPVDRLDEAEVELEAVLKRAADGWLRQRFVRA